MVQTKDCRSLDTLSVHSITSSNPTAALSPSCTDLHKVFLERGQFTVAELFLAGPAGGQGVRQHQVGQGGRQGDSLPAAEGEQQREVKLGRRGWRDYVTCNKQIVEIFPLASL